MTETDKASLGIGSVSTGSLGDGSVGYLSSLSAGGTNDLTSGNLVNAQKILDKAVKQVSQLRAGSRSRSSRSARPLTRWASRSRTPAPPRAAIRDTDFSRRRPDSRGARSWPRRRPPSGAQANASPQSALALLR